MVVGIIMDQNGRPVCSEMWPGNTTDVITLIPVIDRLRQRFAVGRVCIVADRGMISAETIANLEDRGLEYILGVRERSSKECTRSSSTIAADRLAQARIVLSVHAAAGEPDAVLADGCIATWPAAPRPTVWANASRVHDAEAGRRECDEQSRVLGHGVGHALATAQSGGDQVGRRRRGSALRRAGQPPYDGSRTPS